MAQIVNQWYEVRRQQYVKQWEEMQKEMEVEE